MDMKKKFISLLKTFKECMEIHGENLLKCGNWPVM